MTRFSELELHCVFMKNPGTTTPATPNPRLVGMAYKETFWMACDSTEQMRAEYGPFHTRTEAEMEARKLGFDYLLRYEHIVDERDEIQEVRSIFIELQDPARPQRLPIKLHTRCATCGESASHDESWQAEVWADIHEFEHSRHFVRLFEQVRSELKEIANWRDAA
jgi:hypothetical protein